MKETASSLHLPAADLASFVVAGLNRERELIPDGALNDALFGV